MNNLPLKGIPGANSDHAATMMRERFMLGGVPLGWVAAFVMTDIQTGRDLCRNPGLPDFSGVVIRHRLESELDFYQATEMLTFRKVLRTPGECRAVRYFLMALGQDERLFPCENPEQTLGYGPVAVMNRFIEILEGVEVTMMGDSINHRLILAYCALAFEIAYGYAYPFRLGIEEDLKNLALSTGEEIWSCLSLESSGERPTIQ